MIGSINKLKQTRLALPTRIIADVFWNIINQKGNLVYCSKIIMILFLQMLFFYIFTWKIINNQPWRAWMICILRHWEFRLEKKKKTENNQSDKALACFCCECQQRFRSHWGPSIEALWKTMWRIVWCLIAIWSCSETLCRYTPWIEDIITYCPVCIAYVQTQMSPNESINDLGLIPWAARFDVFYSCFAVCTNDTGRHIPAAML